MSKARLCQCQSNSRSEVQRLCIFNVQDAPGLSVSGLGRGVNQKRAHGQNSPTIYKAFDDRAGGNMGRYFLLIQNAAEVRVGNNSEGTVFSGGWILMQAKSHDARQR